jgi:hypothetical protein
LEEKNRIDVDNGAAVSEVDEKVGNRADSGVKEEGLDLGKMTLGEWFDYMEVHLRKQIINATEEMIEGMRQKASEFVSIWWSRGTTRAKCRWDRGQSSSVYVVIGGLIGLMF